MQLVYNHYALIHQNTGVLQANKPLLPLALAVTQQNKSGDWRFSGLQEKW